MERQTLNIVITGHVDHGKSTLIGRLLFDTHSVPEDKILEIEKASQKSGNKLDFAFFADQFREERERLMTMDTCRIWFKSRRRDYVIIDSPGHEELIKNMMTGASSAEAAILIVGAVEGVEDQTKRHSHILKLLGFKSVLVLVNKMDIAGYDEAKFKAVAKAVSSVLKDAGIAQGAVIPISAAVGDNVAKRSRAMSWYKGRTFLEELDRVALGGKRKKVPMRFAVQDIYGTGRGEIAVGRVESGCLKKGDAVTMMPDAKILKVISIEVFGSHPSSAEEGECVGLKFDKAGVAKAGEVICAAGEEIRPSGSFEADLSVLVPGGIKKGEKFMIRVGPQESICAVTAIGRRFDPAKLDSVEGDASSVGEHEIGRVRITCDRPLVLECFDTLPALGRFILESGGLVCGAGVVRQVGKGERK